jgi:YbgC/YbaW family acyl-CoA thioester hydrolase
MTHEYAITVRGYELDSFGHVNNAVYLNYCEQARWEILKSKKNLNEYLSGRKLVLMVVEAKIRYVIEAKLFDELVVRTDVELRRPYLVFNHVIKRTRSGETVVRASINTLLVDDERIPYDIPDSFVG